MEEAGFLQGIGGLAQSMETAKGKAALTACGLREELLHIARTQQASYGLIKVNGSLPSASAGAALRYKNITHCLHGVFSWALADHCCDPRARYELSLLFFRRESRNWVVRRFQRSWLSLIWPYVSEWREWEADEGILGSLSYVTSPVSRSLFLSDFMISFSQSCNSNTSQQAGSLPGRLWAN